MSATIYMCYAQGRLHLYAQRKGGPSMKGLPLSFTGQPQLIARHFCGRSTSLNESQSVALVYHHTVKEITP